MSDRDGHTTGLFFLGSAVGVVAGVALSGMPLLAQGLIGGLAGLSVYWGVPTLWAGVSTVPPLPDRRKTPIGYYVLVGDEWIVAESFAEAVDVALGSSAPARVFEEIDPLEYRLPWKHRSGRAAA